MQCFLDCKIELEVKQNTSQGALKLNTIPKINENSESKNNLL